ncbi:uncharacterized protein LOC131004467 [Salvia miltiorrhiza]|uniref:uncharacterized protein LOC131004467 n=1 Tax=Salvia miltiorrhiza TaxID=226208 RepID=UPI0025AD1ED2|nr:uncharacterized protein LOC131004467 [Salvia miltiorrhiza]
MTTRTRARNNENPEGDELVNHIPIRDTENMFRKQHPPTFDGLGNPLDAEKWVRAIERIFAYIRCEDREKVIYAKYQLIDEADFWWESVERTMTQAQKDTLTWEGFKEKLFEKFIPECYRQKRQNEFWNLRQGKSTVTEYDRAFNRLSRYYPQLVDTDEKKADRFRKGLRPEIAVSLASQGTLTYAQSLTRALNIETLLPKEREKGAIQQFEGDRGKRKWEDRASGEEIVKRGFWRGPPQQQFLPQQLQQQQFQPRQPQQFQQRPSRPQQYYQQYPQQWGFSGQKPVCPQCKKPHLGECRIGTNVCFRCGKSGYMIKDCTNGKWSMKGQQQQGQGPTKTHGPIMRQPQQARAYALNKQQVGNAPENLAGMIYINETPILALFDTGASHSFISKVACEKLSIVTEVPELALSVSIPTGNTVTILEVSKGQDVKIGDLIFKADLHVIDMKGIDVIFRMDWLEKNRATICCQEREILFQTPNGEKIIFQGGRLGTEVPVITAMKANKMLRKGNCQAFLVNLTAEKENELKIDDVSVV